MLSDDWRRGLFSTTIIDPETGLPFANNQIPANRISSVALAVQSDYLPSSNIANGTTVNNYEYHFPFNSDLYRGDWPIVRIDHAVSKNNSLFGRWMTLRTPYVLNNGLPALIWTRIRHHQQWVVGDTHIISATMVNNLRLGFSTDHIVDGDTEAGQTPPDGSKVLTNIGLEGANPSRPGFPGDRYLGLDIAVQCLWRNERQQPHL